MDFFTSLSLSFFFGTIGFGYFMYGKKIPNFVFIISGIILCSFPYFISNVYAFVITGIVFILLPFIIK
jgi:hypothetical protein